MSPTDQLNLPAAEAAGRQQLAEYLRTPSAYDVLDDAVLGSLTVSTVLDLLADFDLTDSRHLRVWLGRQLDDALAEVAA